MTTKIDIHKVEQGYNTGMEKLRNDPTISTHNKELILGFLNDALIGKTVINRQKKVINKQTIIKYIFALQIFARNTKADFDKFAQQDMDNFIRDLETDKIVKIRTGKPYTPRTKVDIKVTIKKFYKVILGNCEEYPKIVRHIDTFFKENEIQALSSEQVEQLIIHAPTIGQRAFIHFLFDSGARIEECLNVRLKHLEYDSAEQCFKVRIEFSKTLPRTIYLPLCSKNLQIFLDTLKDKDPETPLFGYTYNYSRKLLRILGMKYLNRSINPHLLRHSSATYYAPKINPYQMCKRYGWQMSSDMPNRYIDREGISDKITANTIQNTQNNEILRQNQELKNELSIMKQQFNTMIEQISKEVMEKALKELKTKG